MKYYILPHSLLEVTTEELRASGTGDRPYAARERLLSLLENLQVIPADRYRLADDPAEEGPCPDPVQ